MECQSLRARDSTQKTEGKAEDRSQNERLSTAVVFILTPVFRLLLFVEVRYGVGFVGFIDQVLYTRCTDGGDSGSLVIDKKSGKAVGLHFSGSAPEGENRGSSIFNPIQDVLKALGVRLVTR